MKKILSVILITAFIITLFACKKDEGKKDNVTTEEPETEEPEYVFPDLSGIPSPLSVNGEPVSYETFRYYYALVKFKYDNGSVSYWDTHDYSQDISSETMKYLLHDLATEKYAESIGVRLSDYEISQVKDSIESMTYYYGGKYEFNKMLDDNYLTPELYEKLNEIDALYDKLLEYLTGEESGYKISDDKTLVRRYLDNYAARADHILILNDPGDNAEENEKLIKEIYQRLQNGEDFAELKAQYSEDNETANNDVGYYFTEGDIGKEFEEAALSLEIGQMSGIIETHYGWHIIIRLPFDEEYIAENWDSDIVPFYQKHMLEIAIGKVKDAMSVEYDETFYSYSPKNIK